MPKFLFQKPKATVVVRPGLALGRHAGFPAGTAASGASCRRGFATVLILLLIFLMMMLVLIYLRTMRAYTVGHASLDTAGADKVCAQIENDLKALIGNDGQIGGTDAYEPYDYPWTCSRMNTRCQLVYPQIVASDQGLGDPRVDDSWLAPTEPQLLASGGEAWPQVSNLYGSFLAYDNANLSGIAAHPATGLFVPQDVPAGVTIKDMAGAAASGSVPTSPASKSLCAQFQNVPLSDPRLVDADGDGVPDSLWFYPSNSLQGNLRYVAAVRVVDLSSMINLNTALGEAQFTTGASPAWPRKGEGPYEVDASRLIGDALSPPLGAMSTAAVRFRQTQAPDPGTYTPLSPLNAWTLWLAGGAYTDDTGLPYASANANSSATPKTRQGLRYDLNDEIQLRDLSNRLSTGAKAPTPAPILGDHYSALNLTVAKPSRPAVTAFASLSHDLKLRGRVSTLGGVYDAYAGLPYAPDRDDNSAAFSRARRPFDIGANQNNIAIPTQPSGYAAIDGGTMANLTYGGWWDQAQFWYTAPAMNVDYGTADFLKGIDKTLYTNATKPAATSFPDLPTGYPYPEGFRYALRNQGAPSAWGYHPLVFQRQMAASLANALGRDNLPQRDYYNEWLGFKALPVLTEFYAQMPYVAMSPSFLPVPGTTAVVFPNKKLSDFPTAASLEFPMIGGANVGSAMWPAQVYFFSNDGTTLTAQFQISHHGYIECVKIKLTESGNDVVGTTVYAKYVPAASGLGYNFDTGGTSFGTPATTYNGINSVGASLGQATTAGSTSGYSAMYWNTTARRTDATTPADVAYGATDWRANLKGAGVGSYAFELANPYRFPVRLCNLRFEFKRYDYNTPQEAYATGGRNSAGAIAPAGPASGAHGTSADLSTYIDAAPPAGLLRDAEGYWVLRPNEKIVFYRNGFDGLKADGSARRKPFGGNADISSLIAPAGCYVVNLGSDPAVPDLNGHPSTWKVEYFEIQSRNQNIAGAVYAESSPTAYSGAWNYNTWIPWAHVAYRTLASGWDTSANNCDAESNIPAGRQPGPGDLVYRQVDVRTFGVDQKLDCLQARPVNYPNSAGAWGLMPTDLGDCEYATNLYNTVASGTLSGTLFPNGAAIPATTGWPSAGWASIWYDNTASTLALSTTCFDATTSIAKLGQTTKVVFPGPNSALYTNGRQSIKDEALFMNYVGLPDDATYAGTFPELTAAGNANKDARKNATAGSSVVGMVKTGRDGAPHTFDLLKVPLAGPFVHYPGVTGNAPYRGITSGDWATIPQSSSPWIGSAWQNTLGDALNFYLNCDATGTLTNPNKLGLRGLCLRTDVPWFDGVNAATKYKVYNGTTPYPLGYDAATPYVAGMATLYNGEVYLAQQDMTGIAPDPTPDTGNVGPGRAWAYSNGPYARASKFWQLSWGEILCSRWQVGSPKHLGKTAKNGDNWKSGIINLNTAPKEVLKCLSLPTGVDADAVANKIIASREAPVAGVSATRKGLVLVSEAFGPDGLKSKVGALTASTPSAFYTADANFNLETLSWLPQQASCRSDVFCAYIVVQGYKADDFNKGPVDVRRKIVIYSRNTSGSATILASKQVAGK